MECFFVSTEQQYLEYIIMVQVHDKEKKTF